MTTSGEVIKGWDLGVATMKKGEKAILTCGPDYAYGSNGSPPKIPGGATLNFEVRWGLGCERGNPEALSDACTHTSAPYCAFK